MIAHALRRYFKRGAESDLGGGVVYFEFDGEWALRQVEAYGERWFCSDKDYHPESGTGLCDQPLAELGLEPDDEMTREEFESVWDEAQRKGR